MRIFQQVLHSFKNSDRTNILTLELVLERAKIIGTRSGNSGLHDYIRALLYPSMYQHLYNCITSEEHKIPGDNTCFEFFPDERIYNRLTDVKELTGKKYKVFLGHDIVYATPWNSDSINNIGKIGHKKEFVEDPSNHQVVLYQPMDVSFVINGNHSIMQGIITGTGIVHPSIVCDLSDYL